MKLLEIVQIKGIIGYFRLEGYLLVWGQEEIERLKCTISPLLLQAQGMIHHVGK